MYTWVFDMIISTSLAEVREIKDQPHVIVESLEEMTGADLMLTHLKLPVTPRLLSKHLESGALLVQIKRGHDLVSSIIDGRLLKSIATMRTLKARPWQCILLFVGMIWMQDGKTVINGQPVHLKTTEPYWAIKSALSRWGKRGGIVETVDRVAQIPEWVQMQERILIDMKEDPILKLYSKPDTVFEPDDPLQEVIYINDWRKTLLTLPGIGIKKVDALMEWAGDACTLWEALHFLSTQPLAVQIPGIGKGTVESIRAWLGLKPGMELSSLPEGFGKE
jgi:hypothetical protein